MEEKELNEVMEGVVNESETVNRKPSKVAIFGIVAVTVTGLLLGFRKKISAKIEGSMVKRLTKKGYTIFEPEASEKVVEAFTE